MDFCLFAFGTARTVNLGNSSFFAKTLLMGAPDNTRSCAVVIGERAIQRGSA
jgi:hypothetical protein